MPLLDFKGKYNVYAHHLSVPFQPLVPHRDLSAGTTDDSENLIIHGDNLHGLKALMPRYADRVNIVYIDPPYNTGNEGWIYNDNVNSPAMREWLKQQAPVDDEDLERHDKWLCMMWPRLQLLRELMAEDGIIFVSVDQNEQHHLKMLMDEIFGESNFFALLTRRAMHTVRNSSKDFNLNADYVMVYGKDKSWFRKDRSRYIRHAVDKSKKYPHDDGDGRGRYKLDPLHARNYLRALRAYVRERNRMASARRQLSEVFSRDSAQHGERGADQLLGRRAESKALLGGRAGRASTRCDFGPQRRSLQRHRHERTPRHLRSRRRLPAAQARRSRSGT